MIDNKLNYLVKWKGYEEPTWEPIENLQGSKDLIDNFNLMHPEKPEKRKRNIALRPKSSRKR
jgi:hypothetical protein